MTVSGLLVATLVTATVSTAGTAAASPNNTAHPGISSSIAGLSPDVAAMVHGSGANAREQALKAYWTPARRKSARPADELPALRQAAATKPPAAPTKPQGPAGRFAPAAPTVRPTAATTPQAPGLRPAAFYPSYPTGSLLADTVGKVYFDLPSGGWQCSGSIVNTEGKATVWTAGHCVTEGGSWATNWVFIPDCYNNGYGGCAAPFGVWSAYQLWTKTAYLNNNSDIADDVGAALISRQYGYCIANYLGGQGIEWNYPIGQWMNAFGYPVPGFTGVDLTEDYGYSFDGSGYGISGLVGMTNTMTGGSSGGPWLAGWNGDPNSWAYLDGHNDWKYYAYPQYMFSPYYGNQVLSLFNAVRYSSC